MGPPPPQLLDRSPARRRSGGDEPKAPNNIRWNPSTVVQLIAILSISILVAIATILSQHATINKNNNNKANKINNIQSANNINNPNNNNNNGHLSMMHHPKNKRITNEINKLEQQLQALNNEYTAISKEVKQLTNGKIIVADPPPPSVKESDAVQKSNDSAKKAGQHKWDEKEEEILHDNDNEAWDEDTKLDNEKNKKLLLASSTNEQKRRTVVCTKEQCEKKFHILDPNGYFYVGDNYPTKGCFTKRGMNDDGNMYFGTGGSLEEMRNDPENINHVRIWCEEEEENAASVLVDEQKSSSNKTIIRGVGIDGSAVNIKKYIKPNVAVDAMDRKPKKWWIPYNTENLFPELHNLNANDKGDYDEVNGAQKEEGGSIIPFDLSVNHLQLIKKAPGSPNKHNQKVLEEFLPVVLTKDIDFRWRSKARSMSRPEDIVKTTAYQITTRLAHDDSKSILWDSGKVELLNGLPDVVHVNLSQLGNGEVGIGAIIEWSVKVWDSNDNPSTSSWKKFAIGPTQESDWSAKWISHPFDLQSWNVTDASAFWGNNKAGHQDLACHNWEKRSQLPIFRTKIPALDATEDVSDIASVLLVVSGLGSFRASLDGVPLSSSGPLDPPLTDFAQRVSYRGFDVTKFVTGLTVRGKKTVRKAEHGHVLGISMGSGWWDHRPIAGSFIRLFYFPHGAVTCIAQLHITYKKSGRTKVISATGRSSSGWQVAKGHLRESSLFTGEYIDLETMAKFGGWDMLQGWDDNVFSKPSSLHSWVKPEVYKSETTIESWRQSLEMKSNAKKMNVKHQIMPKHKLSPIGKLIPNEIPPVLPMERIHPEEVRKLDNGRWLVDFGVGFSGMIRFENGLPEPFVPFNGTYPRGHTVSTLRPNESFITVVYGESIELTRGDINIAVVAGMGLHDGGPKHKSKKPGDAEAKGGPCYPKDHIEAGSLLQRDVYILPQKSGEGKFADARQSHFTTHAFRFAEICCTKHPPKGMYAMAYRTAFSEWGTFSSSNIRINGGYELVKNAMNSNMLSVQSDCPHREKIQYGGDILADSPSSLHMYDMASFYRKVVWDWGDQQWENGAYAGTSTWLALNDYAGIGTGSGETVWASAPIVMTARHMQHYGDMKLLEESFDNHLKWLNFLITHFDKGMKAKGYDEELKGYTKEGSGLGDWLTFRGRDTWLTHQSFYMATARSIAYIATKLGKHEEVRTALELANNIKDRIAALYLRQDGSFLPPEQAAGQLSPGPEMSLYSRVVPGENRCTVLRRYFARRGHTWPGSDENTFVREMSETTKEEMIESGEITKRGPQWSMGWSQWHGFSEGIFAVRYALKTLSDNGFHNLALAKATGFGCGTFEYMLSHNATTHWESWWRSEDLYSHNHPMLGATAEWMVSAVAGVALHPSTIGGRKVLFWPRFPNSASTIDYAQATQGTRRGDFSIAWRFEDLPDEEELYDSSIVKVHIRLLVPPDGEAVLRLPEYSNGEGVDSIFKYATQVSENFNYAKVISWNECEGRRRKEKLGFQYNWEFDIEKKTWIKVFRKKSIGTPCQSYLFHPSLDDPTDGITWSESKTIIGTSDNGLEVELGPGLYDVMVNEWQLKPEVKGTKDWRIDSVYKFYEKKDIGPYCADSDTFDWNVEDASYLI